MAKINDTTKECFACKTKGHDLLFEWGMPRINGDIIKLLACVKCTKQMILTIDEEVQKRRKEAAQDKEKTTC